VPERVRGSIAIVMLCALGTIGTASRAQQNGVPATTTVIQFTPTAVASARAVDGTCRTSSVAAWFRSDAWACVAGSSTFDPCFRTGADGHRVWCVVDPRQPSGGTPLSVTSLTVTHATPPTHSAWFFELTDGSTCRPLAAPGRVVEGERELYACKFGSAGDADAVLGDLDSSAPLWTVQKVMINKKAEPQTIKSVVVASVRTVWR
jgi:hypothetical protein